MVTSDRPGESERAMKCSKIVTKVCGTSLAAIWLTLAVATQAQAQTWETTARERNPARWSGNTRNWSPIGVVTLNPERDCIIKSLSISNDIQPLAA